ncbi:HTH-type transcriptional regulator CynR [Bacteroidaceae bacterium]|jgi:LysR family cyn operon transcriptional activator|uniref:LysR substrate-binding domain-containing protein n=1 Tax=Prevotellaceae TaxID=171552 RepID=UPI000CEA5ED9|nr:MULTISPECIES: LysR substrate-binding domain-containing protein [Prevotellaceae]GAY30905.1 transcriptional regulator [Prevotella sp. MGM2]GFI34428.1 HTH-type transcriptional regulator CynR [Bacteroidaceae bacterium]
MELRQLKYFVKAAETLNFSDAAKALCITQSTLSQQIRQLEQDMSTPLFLRNSHTVTLTEAGSELLPYARRTLHAANACADRLHDLQQLLAGTLNIGVTFTFSPILTETLIDFMKEYPAVKLNIFYLPMAELMQKLMRREVDFVLAFKPSQCYDGVESHILFDNHLAAVVHDNHPLARFETVSFSDISRYDVALPARGLQAREVFEQLVARYRLRLNVRAELNEVNILLKLIRQSRLVTILSESAISGEQGVRAVPIGLPDTEMQGCVHTLQGTYRKRSACEFIRLLSESNAVRRRVREWLD